MSYYLNAFGLVLQHLKNPYMVLLDRAGLLRKPYIARLKTGLNIGIRPGYGDRFGLFEVFLRGDYLQLGQELRPGDTVLDIGANIGCFALQAAQHVGPTGRVIAVEPERDTYAALEQNIARNHATNITARRLALGAEAGTVDLHVADKSLFSSVHERIDGRDMTGTEVQRVPQMTLGQLLEEEQVRTLDYLKMDCEGAEYDILSEDAGVGLASVRQLILEVHAVQGQSCQALHDKIEAFGLHQQAGTTGEQVGLRYYRRT